MKLKLFIMLGMIFCQTALSMTDNSLQSAPIIYTKQTDFFITSINTIVAFHNNKKAGEVSYRTDYSHIETLFVKPYARRHGIGAELFVQALEDCNAHGAKCISWKAVNSIEYYKRFGARLIHSSQLMQNSGTMNFDFCTDGNPRKNLQHFNKSLLKKQKAH